MPDVMPIVAASVALFILLWLASIALYAMPESDDYCVTNRVNSMGLVGMVKSYYLHQMGRLTSLVAIAAPAVVSKVTGVDYLVVYPVILICGMAIFLAVSVYWAGRMWTGLSWPERFLAGAMLCAASFVLAISLREMLYWISGSASYMVPALFVIIILVELVRSAANETVLSTGQIVVLSANRLPGCSGQRVHAILDRGPRRRFCRLSSVLPSSPATGGPCSDADGDLHRTCDPAFVTGECGPDGGISGGGRSPLLSRWGCTICGSSWFGITPNLRRGPGSVSWRCFRSSWCLRNRGRRRGCWS